MNLPKEYTEKMKRLLGNEYDRYREFFSAKILWIES